MEKLAIVVLVVWILDTIGMFAMQRGLQQVSDKIDEGKLEEERFNAILIKHLKVLGEGYFLILQNIEGKNEGGLDHHKQKVEEVSQELDEWLIQKASRD